MDDSVADTTPTPDLKMVPVDLTELQDAGVLSFVNVAVLWPLGLALTWVHAPNGQASALHIRQWNFSPGELETIGWDPDDPVRASRVTAFRAWLTERLSQMKPEEADQARMNLPGDTRLFDWIGGIK